MVEIIVDLINVSTNSAFVKTNAPTMNKPQASHDHINNLQTPRHHTFNYKRKQCKKWHSININIDLFIYLLSNFTMQLVVGNFFFNHRFWMHDIVLNLTFTNLIVIIGLEFIPCFMFNCGEGQVSWLTLFSNHLRTFLDP
jgi:hypothetical protein